MALGPVRGLPTCERDLPGDTTALPFVRHSGSGLFGALGGVERCGDLGLEGFGRALEYLETAQGVDAFGVGLWVRRTR